MARPKTGCGRSGRGTSWPLPDTGSAPDPWKSPSARAPTTSPIFAATRPFLRRAGQFDDAGDAGRRRLCLRDLPPPDARQRQFAGMRQVIGLDDRRQQLLVMATTEPERRFPPAPASHGAAPHRRTPWSCVAAPTNTGTSKLLHVGGQVASPISSLEAAASSRNCSSSASSKSTKAFKADPGGVLFVPEPVGQRDQIRRLARLVVLGTLADEIVIAGDLAVLAPRSATCCSTSGCSE